MGKGLHVCHCVIVEVIGVCMWSESDSVVLVHTQRKSDPVFILTGNK